MKNQQVQEAIKRATCLRECLPTYEMNIQRMVNGGYQPLVFSGKLEAMDGRTRAYRDVFTAILLKTKGW